MFSFFLFIIFIVSSCGFACRHSIGIFSSWTRNAQFYVYICSTQTASTLVYTFAYTLAMVSTTAVATGSLQCDVCFCTAHRTSCSIAIFRRDENIKILTNWIVINHWGHRAFACSLFHHSICIYVRLTIQHTSSLVFICDAEVEVRSMLCLCSVPAF